MPHCRAAAASAPTPLLTAAWMLLAAVTLLATLRTAAGAPAASSVGLPAAAPTTPEALLPGATPEPFHVRTLSGTYAFNGTPCRWWCLSSIRKTFQRAVWEFMVHKGEQEGEGGGAGAWQDKGGRHTGDASALQPTREWGIACKVKVYKVFAPCTRCAAHTA